jgi:glycosyltransferase involved in cell wall biosynthesis
MSNTILEAMASGLPCVATNVGGNPELISHGEYGYLFNPRDVSGLASCLQRLILQLELRTQFALAARQRAMEHFSLDRMMCSYADLYTTLADQRHVVARS